VKIIVSGGWGYGNLGDDAILDSTIRQLQAQFPGCRCVVLTYDLADSAIHASDTVQLLRGAHALTDGGGCELYIPSMTEDYSLSRKAWVKARFAVTEAAAWFRYASSQPGLQAVQAEIASADLFVMSGGGYFNEKWMNKTRAQLLELEFAEKAGVPAIVLGPTIGRFEGSVRGDIAARFRQVRMVTVRDEFSYAEAVQWNERVSVVPDIALGNWLPDPGTPEGLGIVFTSLHAEFRSRLVQAVQQYVQQRADGLPVKLFITRRWKYDLRAAITLQEELQQAGVACNLIMPSSFRGVEKAMAACELVISENLHGLILAARNLVPVVAVNDYAVGSPNYKKFIAFLSQSNSQELFFSSQSSAEQMVQKLLALNAARDAKRQELCALRESVAQQYKDALGALALPASRT
jgi:polysaccharide pyruvyl transferase WcaK-like protein